MAHVNGLLAAVAKDELENYRKTSEIFARVAASKGAIATCESYAEGLDWGKRTSFPRAVDLQDGEVVVFSWLVWPSKEAADKGNASIMEDAELQAAMQAMKFDGSRMIWGDFNVLTQTGLGA